MSRMALLGGAAAIAAVVLAGCNTMKHDGGAQGWDDVARASWYNADQGSRLMPLAWLKALEQPNAPAGAAAKPFLDPAYLAGFGILPPFKGQALPVGFAVDRMDDSHLIHTNLHWNGTGQVDWVGLNCAACHTAQMTYGGQTITIDGGPALFDYQSFIEAVDLSLAQTRAAAKPGGDAARWDRFAKSVLGADDTPANRQHLLDALDKLIAWEAQAEALNHTGLRYGQGRVDAIGHIYNRVLLFGGAPQPVVNPADAPVSYPHLWNITKQTQLQWDGIVSNAKINIGATPTDYGALGRNTGEVLGVFGEAVLKPPGGPGDLSGFTSSVQLDNLNNLEVLVTKLQPPVWPAAFGKPGDIPVKDAAGKAMAPAQVVQAGHDLFDKMCASCHTPHQTYETMVTFSQMGPNLTDEWMACNAWAYSGASGTLNGVPGDYITGDKLTAEEPVRQLLTTAVKGSLIGKKGEFVKATAQNIFGVTPLPRVIKPQGQLATPETVKEQRLSLCMRNAANPLLAYKARPLEGIWATSPYLHNGSVPTLMDLLKAPADRPKTFTIGSRAFDPKAVGYDASPTAPGGRFTFDTSLTGNSNKGHVYGVDHLTSDQRAELLEYLKTL